MDNCTSGNYNTGMTLEDCLESVISHTCENLPSRNPPFVYEGNAKLEFKSGSHDGIYATTTETVVLNHLPDNVEVIVTIGSVDENGVPEKIIIHNKDDWNISLEYNEMVLTRKVT